METKRMLNLGIVFIGIVLLLTGCEETTTGPETEGKGDLLLVTQVEGVSFVSTVSNLEQGTATNKKAVETVQSPTILIHGDMVFISEGCFGDKIHRYDRADGGELSYVGSLTMPSASWPNSMAFVNATKAYVSLYNAGKLAVINPTDMTKTKEIDLSAYAVGDNCPDPAAMVIRDGKLFVCLHQMISMYSVHDSAFVLVVDVATDSVEKMIIDDRTCMMGLRESPCTGIFVDGAGDIYIWGTAFWGYQPGAKDGFLRIKKGTTEFDPGYFVSLTDISLPDVPGNKGAGTYNMLYTGGSTFYASMLIPAWQSNPPDMLNDKAHQPFKVDLGSQTAEKIDFSPSNYMHGMCEYKNKIVFGLSSVDGAGLYTYDLSTGQVSDGPVVKTTGDPYFILAFE